LFVVVGDVEGGECCKAHVDLFGNLINKRKWCDTYCCIQFLKYDCCDNILLQAPSSSRL